MCILTAEEMNLLKTATGMNRSSIPYRNEYIDEYDALEPRSLVLKGFMAASSPIKSLGNLCVYIVTPKGLAALGL